MANASRDRQPSRTTTDKKILAERHESVRTNDPRGKEIWVLWNIGELCEFRYDLVRRPWHPRSHSEESQALTVVKI